MNETAKPFDPWFATEEEAIAEDLRRKPIIKALSKELKKNELGSDAWHEIRYQLDPLCISAIKQRKTAREMKQNRKKIGQLGGLAFMSLVFSVMQTGLVAPYWLSGEMFKRFTPVWSGDVDSWDSEKTLGKPYPKRKSADMRKEFLSADSLAFIVEVFKQLEAAPAARVNETIDVVAEAQSIGSTKGRKIYDFYKKQWGFDAGKQTKPGRKRRVKRNEKPLL